MLVTKTINMNMKFRKYIEVGLVSKEPNAPLPDIASQACPCSRSKSMPCRCTLCRGERREVDDIAVRSEQSRKCVLQKLDRSSTPRVQSLGEGAASEACSSGEVRALRSPEQEWAKIQHSSGALSFFPWKTKDVMPLLLGFREDLWVPRLMPSTSQPLSTQVNAINQPSFEYPG